MESDSIPACWLNQCGDLLSPRDGYEWIAAVTVEIAKDRCAGNASYNAIQPDAETAADVAELVTKLCGTRSSANRPTTMPFAVTRAAVDAGKQALRRYGTQAVYAPRLPGTDVGVAAIREAEASLFGDLRAAVQLLIERLRERARTAPREARQRARDDLRELLHSMVPEGRGRPVATEAPRRDQLIWDYHVQRLRWELIPYAYQLALRRGDSEAETIARVAEIYDESAEAVGAYIHHRGRSPGVPATPRQAALDCLSERTGREASTIENVLRTETGPPKINLLFS